MSTYEEMKGYHYKLRIVTVEVDGSPPYKQITASPGEKRNQLTANLRETATKAFTEQSLFEEPVEGKLCLSITYRRLVGRCDAANIIGGIADALQDIAYINDSQVREVHYIEEPADREGYTVTVSAP
ncbi:MAG: RusA family crossover junction endodeoxyribonuclease [Dehalococcoidia bacterium]|nr:RusA family crossover junction endodeoxyribonuclease [Dehalococcoidia bacterium]